MRQPTAGAAARKSNRTHQPFLLRLAGQRGRSQGQPVKVATRRPALATRRAIIAAVTGCAVAGVVLQVAASWPVAALCGFDGAALVFVLWVWAGVARADAASTELLARAEDASPTAAE